MKTDICIFAPSFGNGGAEKMTINLCRGFSEHGYVVDLILRDKNIPFLNVLGKNINIIEFSKDKSKTSGELFSYIKEHQPQILLSTKGGDKEAIYVKKFFRSKTKVVLRHGTTFSMRDKNRNLIKRIISLYKLKRLLPSADLIIAVSKGVAEDIQKITGINKDRVKVVPNPTIVPEIFELAKKEIDHVWFKGKSSPIILGAGGFRKSKDFPTLIRAFKILRKSVNAKLVILGDGRKREEIEKLIRKLHLSEHVYLPGFQENPYAFMARADLFVLSSIWEGCPNVLIEAMALGTPVVSTNCPSGPWEILQGGKYGKLVEPGNYEELARAMEHTLKNPLPPEKLKNAVKKYELKNSIKSHIEVLGI